MNAPIFPNLPLQAELLPHGALLRLQAHGVMLNLFPGNLVEGGPANLWLRLQGDAGVVASTPLLGPLSPLRPLPTQPGVAWAAVGSWQGFELQLQLRLASTQAAWFWHLQLHNTGTAPQRIDLLHAQDIGLQPLATIRLNEYYVSHYLDLAPLQHAQHGAMVAARQNQPVAGRHPWLLLGSLRRAVSFATDGLQLLGLAVRNGGPMPALQHGLPGRRLQHEHALAALQDEVLELAAGERAGLGFFGIALANHAAASGPADLDWADTALALPEAQALALTGTPLAAVPASLFATAPWLPTLDLSLDELDTLFSPQRRHEEFESAGAAAAAAGAEAVAAGPGRLLSFFHADAAHVVLRAKEAAVMRPHGHLLRSGEHGVPDETALTSTVWMAGVFHSMVTQGHVGINRLLSTVRGSLGQFVSMGLRVFVRDPQDGAGWQRLSVPSAFEIRPDACRWLYRHAGGLLVVSSAVQHRPHALTLQLRVLQGPPLQLLISQHVVLGGDDGVATAPPLVLRAEGEGVSIGVPAGSELAARFPQGAFVVSPDGDSSFVRWGDDAVLWPDGASRGQSLFCIEAAAAPRFGLRIEGRLVVDTAPPAPLLLRMPTLTPPLAGPLASAAQRLADIGPWYLHNALVHYLAPRGLEQFSGGGWGTRDACQGPLEMLLALDQPGAVRDLLLRVFAAQQASGDWPQWFMFFDRDKHIRAGDSHGDIVFWPLVALGRYLTASGDAALLDVVLPFFDAPEPGTVWQHVQTALALIHQRRIAGTELAAYGHGDWNDSLQPADPALREHLCSAWTVTLHHQALLGLARGLQAAGRPAAATGLLHEAAAVRSDFGRLLVADGVVAGYALFEPGRPAELLLHPRDTRTGLHYSLLPMMHAVLENMLSPAQAQAQAALIDRYLTGPDGARLFDRPLVYRGGPMQLFQRAESSAFFGREIGVMYMHAHLRWAEMLAHLGRAQAFFDALQQAHPIALQSVVPQATRRQANCYYSSSDAAFADRIEAVADYDKLLRGEVPLDGGWRVYSSGPGIVIGLIIGRLLGVRREHAALVLDPVLPQALAGLRVRLPLAGCELELELQPGPLGHGPSSLLLDGAELAFSRGENPYRTGAAVVLMSELRARLQAGARRLVVYTG